MADLKVGDLVKKVRVKEFVGHQGWVTKSFLSPSGTPSVFVSGLPNQGINTDGVKYCGWCSSLFEKVTPTKEEPKVKTVEPA